MNEAFLSQGSGTKRGLGRCCPPLVCGQQMQDHLARRCAATHFASLPQGNRPHPVPTRRVCPGPATSSHQWTSRCTRAIETAGVVSTAGLRDGRSLTFPNQSLRAVRHFKSSRIRRRQRVQPRRHTCDLDCALAACGKPGKGNTARVPRLVSPGRFTGMARDVRATSSACREMGTSQRASQGPPLGHAARPPPRA